jgi:thioredoxin 1
MPRHSWTLLADPAALSQFVRAHRLCLVYFRSPGCVLCETLKPKLSAVLTERFPELALAVVDCAASPELAASQGIFVVPTALVFIAAKEHLRQSRAFSPVALADALQRPYALLLDGA